MKNGEPKTFRECMNIPEVASLDVSLKPHEEAYDAGLVEGIRCERDNQLRDMAKAAMPLSLHGKFDDIGTDGVVGNDTLARYCFDLAEVMLAESDKRGSSGDETL